MEDPNYLVQGGGRIEGQSTTPSTRPSLSNIHLVKICTEPGGAEQLAMENGYAAACAALLGAALRKAQQAPEDAAERHLLLEGLGQVGRLWAEQRDAMTQPQYRSQTHPSVHSPPLSSRSSSSFDLRHSAANGVARAAAHQLRLEMQRAGISHEPASLHSRRSNKGTAASGSGICMIGPTFSTGGESNSSSQSGSSSHNGSGQSSSVISASGRCSRLIKMSTASDPLPSPWLQLTSAGGSSRFAPPAHADVMVQGHPYEPMDARSDAAADDASGVAGYEAGYDAAIASEALVDPAPLLNAMQVAAEQQQQGTDRCGAASLAIVSTGGAPAKPPTNNVPLEHTHSNVELQHAGGVQPCAPYQHLSSSWQTVAADSLARPAAAVSAQLAPSPGTSISTYASTLGVVGLPAQAQQCADTCKSEGCSSAGGCTPSFNGTGHFKSRSSSDNGQRVEDPAASCGFKLRQWVSLPMACFGHAQGGR